MVVYVLLVWKNVNAIYTSTLPFQIIGGNGGGLNKRGDRTDNPNINKWGVQIKGGQVWKMFLAKSFNPLPLIMGVTNKCL